MTAIPVVWGTKLKEEYTKLFATCVIKPQWQAHCNHKAQAILANKARYQAIANQVGSCPWWVVGLIHTMEAGGRFDRHLHNGDILTGRTTHVPAGRPKALPASGKFPYTFEESAVDALKGHSFHKETDWTPARVLFLLEGFNGYGYRQYHPTVLSPYLWSFTNHYTKGKYVADGKWSSETVSLQCGAAAVLKSLSLLTPL